MVTSVCGWRSSATAQNEAKSDGHDGRRLSKYQRYRSKHKSVRKEKEAIRHKNYRDRKKEDKKKMIRTANRVIRRFKEDSSINKERARKWRNESAAAMSAMHHIGGKCFSTSQSSSHTIIITGYYNQL